MWRFMQTDPNWGNFLYDEETGVMALIDFGAAREFPARFVGDYLRMVRACARRDCAAQLAASRDLGFLTGACITHTFCTCTCMRRLNVIAGFATTAVAQFPHACMLPGWGVAPSARSASHRAH